MIKNIVFDFGNVLVRWDPHFVFDPYFGDVEKAAWFIENVCDSKWNGEMDRGKTYAQGIRELTARFPQWAKEIQYYYDKWPDMLGGEIPGMSGLICSLKDAGYGIYGITNWSVETFPIARARYRIFDFLDGMVVSGEEHLLKPEPEIYRKLFDRYGLVPGECVFIDDNADKVNLDWRVGLDETPDNAIADVNNWNFRDDIGRFDKTAALAIKARVLLYAASPRNNPDADVQKWKDAAQAAWDVIKVRQDIFDKGFGYGTGGRTHPSWHMPANRDYGNYFLKNNAANDVESIFLIRRAAGSAPEAANYPIATRGGASGICPTQNLVDAYGYVGPEAPDPYINRDPRFYATVVYNGSVWNGNIIDESRGAAYDQTVSGASKTGYYLKKFLAPNLNLVEGGSTDHIWPLYRYAEVLLNYAEAMNEAYGPDADPNGWGMTARDALTEVRNSASSSLPAVTASSKADFRKAVKNERQVELAFEDHRYWDLLRWEDAENVLNRSVKGVVVSKNSLGGFQYTYKYVGTRVFDQKNYYLPFSRKEIANAGGTLTQNPFYN